MDAFYQELYCQIFMRWILLNPKHDITMTHTCDPYEQIHLSAKHSIATVTLYPNCIIEEQAWDRKTHKVIFYIHFQMANLAHATRLYEDLLETIYENCSQPLAKILLVCSGGLTTSYFASKMQELCDLEHLNYKIDAVGSTMVYQKATGYDLILAAPQVSYIYIDHVGLSHVIVSPDSSQKCITGQHDILIDKQSIKEVEFPACQLYLFPCIFHFVAARRQCQVAASEEIIRCVLSVFVSLMGAASQREPYPYRREPSPCRSPS